MSKLNLSKEIYKTLIAHCGKIDDVKGVTRTTLEGYKAGKGNPTLKTVAKIFQENGMPSSIVIEYKPKQKEETTTTTVIHLFE